MLAGIRPRGPRLGDHAFAVLTVLAAPAPHIVRALVSLGLVATVVASATVASADALPDEPLYGVKLASEQVRLRLAVTPVDRAAVRLSMAEHRLAEAERLALAGREPEALFATSAYGTHLAQAAAELARIERLEVEGPTLVQRLKERLLDQQQRAADVAAQLASDPASARSVPLFESVASAAPQGTGGTLSERIAEHAASVTDQVAAVAEQRAQEQPAEPVEPAVAAAEAEPSAAPVAAARVDPAKPAAAEAPRPEPRRPEAVGAVTLPEPTTAAEPASGDDRAREAERRQQDAARQAAEREAAEREAERKRAETARQAEDAGDFQKKLAELRRKFLAALEQIKQKQREAHDAADTAKERGKKTPSPAPDKKGR